MNQGHWIGLKAEPDKYFGFIYLITDKTTGKKYIGKKQYWMSKVAKGCKGKVTDRQSPKWKTLCWRESDWKTYKGSSPSLEKWMKENPSNDYCYEIIHQCRSKGILHYLELKEQWSNDVLVATDDNGEYKYFNRSIGAIRFRPKVI